MSDSITRNSQQTLLRLPNSNRTVVFKSTVPGCLIMHNPARRKTYGVNRFFLKRHQAQAVFSYFTELATPRQKIDLRSAVWTHPVRDKADFMPKVSCFKHDKVAHLVDQQRFSYKAPRLPWKSENPLPSRRRLYCTKF